VANGEEGEPASIKGQVVAAAPATFDPHGLRLAAAMVGADRTYVICPTRSLRAVWKPRWPSLDRAPSTASRLRSGASSRDTSPAKKPRPSAR